jgi:hypothetical protein
MTLRMPSKEALPPYVRGLVEVLADPGRSVDLDLATWDGIVRVARSSQLLGTLAARMDAAGSMVRYPAPVRNHLRAATMEARYLRHMALLEIELVARALAPRGVSFALLKGAGYVAADLPVAAGRMLRDVDLLVPRHRLAEVESALFDAGWRTDERLDAYDQRYYRAWSHQLPPMRRADAPLEVDVHHAILPVTGRIRPDSEALMRDAIPTGRGWKMLDPADRVVHAAVHLFQDSNCTDRLRDVVDIDALCRDLAAREAGFWARLVQRAELHGAMRPVGYAVEFARGWFGTPVGDEFDAAWRRGRGRWASGWVIRRAQRSLPPTDFEQGRDRDQLRAARWMFLRSMWLRMPPWLLAYHAAMKGWRGTIARSQRPPGAGNR